MCKLIFYQDGDAFPAEGQRQTYYNKLNFHLRRTRTARGSTVQLTGPLTCVPERGVLVLQGDVTGTAVVR